MNFSDDDGCMLGEPVADSVQVSTLSPTSLPPAPCEESRPYGFPGSLYNWMAARVVADVGGVNTGEITSHLPDVNV